MKYTVTTDWLKIGAKHCTKDSIIDDSMISSDTINTLLANGSIVANVDIATQIAQEEAKIANLEKKAKGTN